jgi:hypothetical protein
LIVNHDDVFPSLTKRFVAVLLQYLIMGIATERIILYPHSIVVWLDYRSKRAILLHCKDWIFQLLNTDWHVSPQQNCRWETWFSAQCWLQCHIGIVGTPLVLFHLVKGDTAIPPSLLPDKKPQDTKAHSEASHSPPPKSYSNQSTADAHHNNQLSRRGGGGTIKAKTSFHHGKPDDFPGIIPNQFRGMPLLGSIKPYATLQRWKPRHGCVLVSY